MRLTSWGRLITQIFASFTNYTWFFLSWRVGGCHQNGILTEFASFSVVPLAVARSRLYRAVLAIMRLLVEPENDAKYREIFHFDDTPHAPRKKNLSLAERSITWLTKKGDFEFSSKTSFRPRGSFKCSTSTNMGQPTLTVGRRKANEGFFRP